MSSNIFQEVRENVSIAQAIEFLRIKPTETKGEQLRFPCSRCGGDSRVLSVNLTKGFRCFAGDKKGDDATALVAHVLGIRNGEAAQKLKEHFIRPGSATKPEAQKAEGKGRSDSSHGDVRPLEILGISEAHADRLGIREENGRVLFIQRDSNGAEVGTLALGTREDLPLVEWIEHAEEHAEAPSTLQGLWRIVKGGA